MFRVRVTGICFNDRGEVLVLRQEVNNRRFALPGGGVEAGETLESALKREFLEETGLEIAVGRVVYVAEYDRADKVHVLEIAMMARIVGGSLVAGRDKDEASFIEEAFFVPKDKLDDYLSHRDIITTIQNAVDSCGTYIGSREA